MSTASRPKATDAPKATDEHPDPPEPDDPRLSAWRAFLYAQSSLMPRLDAELREASGLTLAEFDALAQIGFAPQRRLRMSVLADRVLLSRSGVTRLVDRLVKHGDVRRESCEPDGRGAYAVLTDQGSERVRAAMPDHLAAVGAHFLDLLDADEIAALVEILGRVAAANGRPLPSAARSDVAMRRLAD